MNVYLFFDTETTGLVDRRADTDAASQPNLVQLATKVVAEDRIVRGSLNVLIEANGWKIPKQASDVHGDHEEVAGAFCTPRRSGLSAFSNPLQRSVSYCSAQPVEHNHAFDSVGYR